jgi:cytochrome c
MKSFNAAVIATGLVLAMGGSAFAQDAAKGKSTFNQCMACHRIGPDAKALVGPPLTTSSGARPGRTPASLIPT